MVLLQRAGYRQKVLLEKKTKRNLSLEKSGLKGKNDLEKTRKEMGPKQKAKKQKRQLEMLEQEVKKQIRENTRSE